MILIADSGSTKTRWWLAGQGKFAESLQTPGLNPFFHTREKMENVLAPLLKPWLGEREVRAVFFYGAGCSTPANVQMVAHTLESVFRGNPPIHVENDLLGAARALFGREPGIACILGTGSNACLYDGSTITHTVPSLGYLFGDEGSGAHMGKTFITSYLKEKLPDDLRRAFDDAYGLDRAGILEAVYRKDQPNRFLASFAVFLHRRMEHPYVAELVEECLASFFTEMLCRLPDYPRFRVGCIGSVGYHFRDVIRKLAGSHGLSCKKFLVSPMEGLLAYHSRA